LINSQVLLNYGTSGNQAQASLTLLYDGYSLVNSGPTGPTGRGIINADTDTVLGSAIGALYPTYIINSSETDFVGIASKYVDGDNNNTPSIIFGDNTNDTTNDLSFSFLSYVPGPPASYTSSELLKLTWDGKLYLNNTPTNSTSGSQYLIRDSTTGEIQYTSLNQTVFVNNTTFTTYNPSINDYGKTIRMNLSAVNKFEVPWSFIANFPIGTTFSVIQAGSGQTSITGANSSVSIRSRSNFTRINGRYGQVTIAKTNTDEWYLWGDLF
jgi:hypothetical protein